MNPLARRTVVRTRVPYVVCAALLAVLFALTVESRSVAADGATAAKTSAPAAPSGPRTPWPKAVVEAARRLPIQEGGRIMPLAQWARYTLLRLNGRGSVKDVSEPEKGTGRSLEPVEWALDVMFRPEEAAKYEVFVVDAAEVLDAVGYSPSDERKDRRRKAKDDPQSKRDRYSYLDLLPVQPRLMELARKHAKIDPKKRSTVQGETVTLAASVRTFLDLAYLFKGAQFEVDVDDVPALKPVFGKAASVRSTDVLAHLRDLPLQDLKPGDPKLGDPNSGDLKSWDLRFRALKVEGVDEKRPSDIAYLLLSKLNDAFSFGRLLAVFPPEATRDAEDAWYTPSGLFDRALEKGAIDAGHLTTLRHLEAAVRAAESDDMTAFTREFGDLLDRTEARAAARAEGRWVRLEVFFVRLDPFLWARTLYLVSFLLIAASWLWRKSFIVGAAWTLLFAGLLIHAAGITIRCVIQSHPPVKSLYETVLFISGCGVLGATILEFLTRRGFGFALAPVFGVLGLFVASGYEATTGEDTMGHVVAVLDTNFWLTLHVLCISLGYCVTLLASFVAHLHVAAHVFDWKPSDPEFRKSLGRATYGILAFGLLFSTVGTILGGVWANDSWGRFWGWDPKENGALLIVLSQLAVLHGRMGGMLNPVGVSLGAIATGCVVAFSWWGVNLLGVGLHSYGFTAGLWTSLLTFWGLEAIVLAAGISPRWLPATIGFVARPFRRA